MTTITRPRRAGLLWHQERTWWRRYHGSSVAQPYDGDRNWRHYQRWKRVRWLRYRLRRHWDGPGPGYPRCVLNRLGY